MKAGKLVRNVVAVVLFGLLIVSFALFGINGDVLKPVPRDVVVSVGGEEVKAAEYKAQFDRYREQASQQIGRPVTVDEAVAQKLDERLLQQLYDQSVFAAALQRLGLKVSPQIVAEGLREVPAFFDQVTGRFDSAAYQQRVSQLGYTPARFEKMLANDVAGRYLTQALEAGVSAPLTYGALQGAVMLESRDISGILVVPSAVGSVGEPTDAQLKTLLVEQSARYQRPERRELSFVRLSAAQQLNSVTADPQQVQKLLDFRKDQAATPETRTFVQIPVKDSAAGASVAQRLAKGEDPQVVAKAVGAEVVRYDAKPKSAIPDRKIAEAAFGLPAGQTSGVVQGDLALAVLKVVSVTPGSAGDLGQMRAQIEQEVKARAAEAKITEAADAMEDAIAKGANLETAARAANLAVIKTPLIDQAGRGDAPAPIPGLSAKLVAKAFTLPMGATSEFETEQPGEYFLVRADKVVPQSLPPLDEVRAQLAADWKTREIGRRLAAKGNEIAARLRKGETVEAVAASAGGQVVRIADLTRAGAGAHVQALGQNALIAAFTAKKGEVLVADAPQGRVALKVDAVRAGPAELIARGAAANRGQIQQGLAQDIGASLVSAARSAVKGKRYLDRAREAIGASTPEAEKGKTADKAKDKA